MSDRVRQALESVGIEALSNRRALLMEAADLVDGDRNRQYGDPTSDFQRTADFWNTYLAGVLERKIADAGLIASDEVLAIVRHLIDTWDVATMQELLKVSRRTWQPGKQDSWADSAGYVACGWDCVVRSGDE